ncbi:MAG: hypothetical protein Q8J97_07785, partial [Flavobacteriaceae bacterium]|nr:hypothetical protein [Flavobacteriaceae bacterium]
MSSNLQLTDEDLAGTFSELDNQVKAVRDAKLLMEKKQLEVVARKQYKKARTALSAFNSEIKKCDDAVQKNVFSKKFASYEERLKAADKELKDQIH